MKKVKLISIFVILSLMVAGAATVSAAEKNWVMGTSIEGTWGYRVATGMARLVDKYTEGINLSVQPGWDTTAGIHVYNRGEAQVTYTNLSAITDAWNDAGVFKNDKIKYKPYQGLWFLSSAHTFVVPADNTDINCWSDLAGKKVFPGAAGTGSFTLAQLMLSELDLWMGQEKAAKLRQVGMMEVPDAMNSGVIDASICYVLAGQTLPSAFVNLDSRMDIRVVEPSEEEKEKISKLTGIVAGYPIEAERVFQQDVGVDNIWGVALLFGWHFGPSEDTETVYQIVKTWYEHSDELAEIDKGFTEFDRRGFDINASAYSALSDIPVHPGVAKYLKEIGKWNDDWKIGELYPRD